MRKLLPIALAFVGLMALWACARHLSATDRLRAALAICPAPLNFASAGDPYGCALRLAGFVENNASPSPSPSASAPPGPAGVTAAAKNRWTHPRGLVSVDVPDGFTLNPVAPSLSNFLLLYATNLKISGEIDVLQVVNIRDPDLAWRYVVKVFQAAGISLNRTKTFSVDPDGTTYFKFFSQNSNIRYNWYGICKPIPNGALFVAMGASSTMWEAEQENVQRWMTENVHFK